MQGRAYFHMHLSASAFAVRTCVNVSVFPACLRDVERTLNLAAREIKAGWPSESGIMLDSTARREQHKQNSVQFRFYYN